jgi:hypothetical protein
MDRKRMPSLPSGETVSAGQPPFFALRISPGATFAADGYQLGEHGIYCKVTNFEDAVHTVLIISWPGQQHAGVSNSFVEFVDLFPTLSDLAGIPVPPLCPENSSQIALCTEGVSLRPIFSNPAHAVKRASFSQYPHRAHLDGSALSPADTHFVTIGDETVEDVAAAPPWQGDTSCPASALGMWLSQERHEDQVLRNNVFVLRSINNLSDGGVTLDISGCHQCSFRSATGHQTDGGVTLTLHFSPPSTEVDAMVPSPRHQYVDQKSGLTEIYVLRYRYG